MNKKPEKRRWAIFDLNGKRILTIYSMPKRNEEQIKKILIEIDDSTKSGNCKIGTEQFRKIIDKKLEANGDVGAYRADFLFSENKNNDFVKRAIAFASLR